jgi:hypothetical protein
MFKIGVLLLVTSLLAVHADDDPCGLSMDYFLALSEHDRVTSNQDIKPISNAENITYPVWPLQFNATLQKINPDNHNIQWTKLYYDWKILGMRFSFFDYYQDVKGNWGPEYCEILFTNTTIYFIKPKIQSCKIRAKDIQPVSPHWLKTTEFKGYGLFREMYSELWEFPKQGTPLDGIQYRARVGKTYETRIPLRSTNQQGDPGVTDYTDFVVGAQNPKLFEIPSYCPKD